MKIGAPSIRTRLTLWYACSILLLFVGAGAVLRVAVRRILLSEFDGDAVDSSTLVRNFFHVEAIEYHTIEQAVTDLVAEVVFPDRAIEFVRPDGSVLVPAAQSARHPPGDPRPDASSAADAAVEPPIRTLTVPLDTARAPGWSIRIISSAADLESTLRHIDQWFAAGGVLIVLLAAGVGWTLTGRLLHPVDAMANSAEQITAAEPMARLPIQNSGDELGRLGHSFNEVLDRLDDALGQQRRFLADAAHELRSPIARMRSVAELTLSTSASDSDARATLSLVSDDLRHASQLLDELLQLARADAGERMQRVERVFLDDVVMDAVSAWRPVAERHGIELDTMDIEEAPVRVDPLLARRLVDTLVENAVRYTPLGGHIETGVRMQRDSVQLTVSDSGIGITPEELPRIFERFFRGTASRSMVPEGSGLGLPIAAWIVDQCSGTISVANREGGGVVVLVSLPAEPVEIPSLISTSRS